MELVYYAMTSWFEVIPQNQPRIKQISVTQSANKLSTSCVRTACPKLSTSLEQAVNNL